MDSLAGPSSKKRCVLTNEDKKRPLECVREFQLPQQYPSTMKQILKTADASILVLPDATRESSSTGNQVPQKLHRLRILSAAGKDLGEFNVERSADPSKGNTMMITKSNLKHVDQPLTLQSSPTLHMRTIPRILKQSTPKISKCNLTDAISCGGSTNIVYPIYSNGMLQFATRNKFKKILPKSQLTEGKVKKRTCNNSINTSKVCSTSEISSKCSIGQAVNSSNQKNLVYNRTEVTDIHNCIETRETVGSNEVSSDETPVFEGIREMPSSAKCSTPVYEEIMKIPSSANCKRLAIKSNDRNNVSLSENKLNVSKKKCITLKNTESGEIVMYVKSAVPFVRRHKQLKRNLNRDGSRSNDRENDNDEVLYDIRGSFKPDVVSKAVPEVKTQNVMTIIPNDKALSFNENAVLECSTPLSSSKNVTDATEDGTVKYYKYDNTQSKNSKARSQNHLIVTNSDIRRVPEPQRVTNVGANVQSSGQSKDCSKDYDRLNIIKKAMDSVKDNGLRKLALKALTDCGIGFEKYVPKRPPKNYTVMHDTQVQTVVFGLLDPKHFILINKDLDAIHRLNQITLHDVPDNEDVLTDNPPSSNFAPRDTNVIEQENPPFDFDNFMEQFWKENSDALEMKETLSTTRVRCNNLLEHLQRDFENVNRYDENGMLNIHNAVLSDNVYFVQRQLMVLQHCKQSVDVLTEDGATSLELAIKYDVCSEIVRLLLDAGAQPAMPRSLHESAVISASKQPSPWLPMLIDRICDPKLLDQIDSEGFAAIHYCSIHGYLQGVKALIAAGATIDLKDMKSGRTSLFHAIDNGHSLVMRALLRAGAVATIANYAGQTPISIISDSKCLSYKSTLGRDT